MLHLAQLAEVLAYLKHYPAHADAVCRQLELSADDVEAGCSEWAPQIASALANKDVGLLMKFANAFGQVERRILQLRPDVGQIRPLETLRGTAAKAVVVKRSMKALAQDPSNSSPPDEAAPKPVFIPTYLQPSLLDQSVDQAAKSASNRARDDERRASVGVGVDKPRPVEPVVHLAPPTDIDVDATAALPLRVPPAPAHPFVSAPDEEVARRLASVKQSSERSGSEEPPVPPTQETAEIDPSMFASMAAAFPFAAPEKRLTLEQFASLQASIEVFPEQAEAIYRRFELHETGQRAAMTERWKVQIAGDPVVEKKYAELRLGYRAYLEERRRRGLGPW